jgi:hypothetical protein
MTARFSVKNGHIEDDLLLVFKKQTPAVKVITVSLKVVLKCPCWLMLLLYEITQLVRIVQFKISR